MACFSVLLQPVPPCLAGPGAALKFGDQAASSTPGQVGYLQLVDTSLIPSGTVAGGWGGGEPAQGTDRRRGGGEEEAAPV